MDRYIECGKIVNTRGLAGEVKVQSWCDTAQDLTRLQRVFIDDVSYLVTVARIHANHALIKLDGIDDVNAAMRLKGKTIYADRNDICLEDGAFFIQDALRLPVYNDEGDALGVLADILTLPASDVLVVRSEGRPDRLIPNVDEFVKLIDIENKRIVVTPIEGM